MEVNIVAEDPPPYATTSFTGEDAFRGYEYDSGAWTPTGTADLNLASPSPLTTTDIVHIQLGNSCGAYVSEKTDNSGATGNEHVTYPNTCDFQQDEAVLITDCTNADLFQITNVVNPGGSSGKQTLAHGSGNNTQPKLGTVYDTDSEIFKFSTVTYYIGSNDEGEPALYKSKWNPEGTAGMTAADFDDPLELADGVEDMQILYGEDTGGGDDYADEYVAAKDVDDWTEVRSARINLLLRSEEGITSKPQTITFNGASVGGADSRLRMIYTSTVTLRNRLP
jgi:type IV pilus assembly protein PilW